MIGNTDCFLLGVGAYFQGRLLLVSGSETKVDQTQHVCSGYFCCLDDLDVVFLKIGNQLS